MPDVCCTMAELRGRDETCGVCTAPRSQLQGALTPDQIIAGCNLWETDLEAGRAHACIGMQQQQIQLPCLFNSAAVVAWDSLFGFAGTCAAESISQTRHPGPLYRRGPGRPRACAQRITAAL